jgi:PAS domain S-box-containing protein
LVFVGEEMMIKTVNENMLKMLGRDSGIIGKPFFDVLPELRSSPLVERLMRVYRTGETFYQFEEKLNLNRSGSTHSGYYDYIYKPLYDTSHHIYGIMVTATDVTKQVLSRQKVEIAEHNLRNAIELAKLGTWSINLQTSEVEYSPRLRKWFGIEGDARLDMEAANRAIVPDDHEAVREFLSKTIRTKAVTDIEFRVIPPHGGRERIIHAQGQCFYDGNGEPYRVSGTSQDVTVQRKIQLALEQQVQERTEELQSLNQVLSATNEELFESNKRLTYSNEELAQYAYVASHDLQEPLRKIRMFSDILNKKTDLEELVQELVGKINRSAERMSLLIESLLEFSRLLKSDTLTTSVDLNIVVGEVKDDFELVIQEKRAIIDIGELAVIEAIGLQMNQLFYNLISNGLKFTRPGVTPVIKIRGEFIESEVAKKHINGPVHFPLYYHIRVSDNGIGIESQYSDQIFEVFKRLHRREIYPGSGIGLALCRRIVANHSGYIYIESAVNEGTTFHILLPASKA